MIGIGVSLILGILIGFYAGNPMFRRKVNTAIQKRGASKIQSPNACMACDGVGLQTTKSGLQVQCPVCGNGEDILGKL